MIRKFKSIIPFGLQDSTEIIIKSGNSIPRWKLINSNTDTGFIEWRQSFCSGSGLAQIKIELEETANKETFATMTIYRPLQVWDPAKMCERVYKKLEQKIKENSYKNI